MALASDLVAAGLRIGETRYALALALLRDDDTDTAVRIPPRGLGPAPLLGPGQRVELVDATVTTAADGSPILTLGQGLIERLRGLEAAHLGRSCALCGCTDDVACIGGCWWATPEVCSSCAPIALVPT